MKIALLGYGRMGKAIEKIALNRGHEIVLKIDIKDTDYDIAVADIAIDFSNPEGAYQNLCNCVENNVPVVSGTTGWLEKYDEFISYCESKQGSFIYASNFSIGVNLFFNLNEYLAKMMENIKGYDVAMEEIHHVHKLDAPSGTAITLAEQIIQHGHKDQWTLENTADNDLHIEVKREGEVPGTHLVQYKSEVDAIEIKHTAFNREGFALGAVIAAEWLVNKKGVFNMKDVLNIA
ncbi:MAG: 4-hydroxy-tetrahydrodipicolinate reductase [Flavobacteriaceae bacterium]|nr:4-hydroxy-tetrahydrodipicolinate reductase [Flavobacteriaceae bacterium]